MGTNMYFVIVGTRDNPIFEAEFGPSRPDVPARMKEENKHLNQFIVHAALDMVDEIMWNTKEMWAFFHCHHGGMAFGRHTISCNTVGLLGVWFRPI